MSAYNTHTEKCPYCGMICEADWVDVGVGMVQCGPFHCENCYASQIGPHDEERELTQDEERTGWYSPNSEPGSSANVIGGRIVGHEEALKNYKDLYPFSATDEGRKLIRSKINK